jgi:hypothetical protein
MLVLPHLSVTQSNIQTALISFLASAMPSGMEIVEGQDNRVPEPVGQDFIVFTIMRRDRLSTNVDAFADCAFTASISGNIMDVTAVQIGTVAAGNLVFGSGIAVGTRVSGTLTGTGGIGTYLVSVSQTIGSEQMAAGSFTALQAVNAMIQIDVHGPNSSDNAQIITTLFRDDYAYQIMRQSGFDVAPLHADDPKQIPFINAEQQYEYRWVIEAHMQANQIVLGIPQQFFDVVDLNVESVTVEFPN